MHVSCRSTRYGRSLTPHSSDSDLPPTDSHCSQPFDSSRSGERRRKHRPTSHRSDDCKTESQRSTRHHKSKRRKKKNRSRKSSVSPPRSKKYCHKETKYKQRQNCASDTDKDNMNISVSLASRLLSNEGDGVLAAS